MSDDAGVTPTLRQKGIPEPNIWVLHKGYAEVNVESIEYQYEDSTIPETIDYIEKNIVAKAAVQLKEMISSCK